MWTLFFELPRPSLAGSRTGFDCGLVSAAAPRLEFPSCVQLIPLRQVDWQSAGVEAPGEDRLGEGSVGVTKFGAKEGDEGH